MRKLIAFGALLALAAALIGCEKKNVENRSDKESRSLEARRLEAARKLIQNVGTALNMYNMKKGGYPDSLEELTKETDEAEALLRGDYIDPWGNALRYEKRGKRRPFIGSAGPDGKFDTDDDITNQEIDENTAREGRRYPGNGIQEIGENTIKRLGE